jgi:hypothetical protein
MRFKRIFTATIAPDFSCWCERSTVSVGAHSVKKLYGLSLRLVRGSNGDNRSILPEN